MSEEKEIQSQEEAAGTVMVQPQELDPKLQEMMEAGLHFGHNKSRTHPKMRQYVNGIRNMVHLIDVKQTKEKLEEALSFAEELAKDKKTLLFIGTKVQIKTPVRETAQACGFPYIVDRWIGGLFTNFEIVSKRIELLKELEEKEQSGELKKYTKKERLMMSRQKEDLEKKFGGVKKLEKLPDAIFICDLDENQMALREAQQKGIPVIAITDTNTDPSQVEYPIPANDDAVSSVHYILDKFKDILAGVKPAKE